MEGGVALSERIWELWGPSLHLALCISSLWLFYLLGTSLVVHWLRLHASTAEGTGSVLGQGTSPCSTVKNRRK